MGDLALAILRSIYIVHGDGFEGFVAADAHPFPSGSI